MYYNLITSKWNGMETKHSFNQRISLLSKKFFSIIIFLITFYVLPLSGTPRLLLNWQIIFLASFCTILYATQPRISLAESKINKSSDKGTMWLIIGTSGIGQIISLLEWAYFPKEQFGIHVEPFLVPPGMETHMTQAVHETNVSTWTIAGALLIIGGTLFRLHAIQTLGKHFSSTIQIKEQQKIITKGCYKFLRHPSYTGAYIAMLGSAIFLQSIAGILIFGFAMLAVYDLRIKTEERMLIQNFKEEYSTYSKHTWKMFPLIW